MTASFADGTILTELNDAWIIKFTVGLCTMTIYTEACVRSQFSGCCDYKAYGFLVYLRVKGNHYAALTNSFSYLFFRFKLPE